MRAVAVRAFHTPPELMDLPRPAPQNGQVLVRIAAAGINPLDWKIPEGIYEGHRAHVFPLVLGVDGAGTVEGVGAGVRRFVRGDRIFGQFLADPVGFGTYAEFTVVPESIGVSSFPSSLSAVEAAAIPTAGMTALSALDRLELAAESTLLVVGASGGVGSFATQLAHARGLNVVVVARPSSADRLRTLGAREFVDVTADDWLERVRGLHPEGVDGALDLMSDRPHFARVAALVRPGGRAASTTYAADAEALPKNGVTVHNANLAPSSELLDRVREELAAHQLPVPVEKRIALADAPDALKEIRSGRVAGKTVIVVSPNST